MGIRIHKDIGYYLPKKHFSKVMSKKFRKIIDDGSYLSIEQLENISKELDLVMTELGNHSVFSKYQMSEILKKDKVDFRDFLRNVFDYDTEKGLLFLTPDLAKSCRWDDLIDFYENNTNYQFKIQFLKKPIYPLSYYYCIETPPLSDDSKSLYAEESKSNPELKKGSIISNDKLHYLSLMEGVSIQDKEANPWAYPAKNKPKYFHPEVDIIIFAFARSFKLIKPELIYSDFIQFLEPAIITSWG